MLSKRLEIHYDTASRDRSLHSSTSGSQKVGSFPIFDTCHTDVRSLLSFEGIALFM